LRWYVFHEILMETTDMLEDLQTCRRELAYEAYLQEGYPVTEGAPAIEDCPLYLAISGEYSCQDCEAVQ
jgi:hypothetical protein